MFKIFMKAALPMLLQAVESKAGKEAMDMLRAGFEYGLTLPLSGEERKAIALARFHQEAQEAKLAIMDELAKGIPWYINLALEGMVARKRISSEPN